MKPKKKQCRLSPEEVARIKWLTAENLKAMGRKYKKAAEDMAVFQVAMEHEARHTECSP